MTRSIDLDQFDPTIEEKFFHGAKRVCIVCALVALPLGALDLLNIRSAENFAKFIHENRMDIAGLPGRIRAEYNGVWAASASPSVTVAIPRDAIAASPRMASVAAEPIVVNGDFSPAAALAALRRHDAVEVAIVPPPVTIKSQQRVAAEPATVTPPPEPLKLASADPAALPAPAINPVPVSAPISAAIPLDTPPMQRATPVVPESIVLKDAVAPLAALDDLRHHDATAFAMAPPPSAMTAPPRLAAEPSAVAPPLVAAEPSTVAPPPSVMTSPLRVVAEPAAVTPPPQPMKLASVDPGALTAAPIDPVPVSLPMSAAIPIGMVPMPRPAPGVPPPSPAQRLHLEGKEFAKAERCLANAIYFESRSEPVRGQMAVAQVVINRVFSGFYPGDVCGVVYQNASRHLACQFTFACDGKSKVINERGAWARANRIAKQTLDGQIYVPEVAKSTHYHAVYVHPNWVREMKKMVRYGIHNFYRPYAWGNGAEEPVWGSPALLAQNKKK